MRVGSSEITVMSNFSIFQIFWNINLKDEILSMNFPTSSMNVENVEHFLCKNFFNYVTFNNYDNLSS